jgi:hypothetical protein
MDLNGAKRSGDRLGSGLSPGCFFSLDELARRPGWSLTARVITRCTWKSNGYPGPSALRQAQGPELIRGKAVHCASTGSNQVAVSPPFVSRASLIRWAKGFRSPKPGRVATGGAGAKGHATPLPPFVSQAFLALA